MAKFTRRRILAAGAASGMGTGAPVLGAELEIDAEPPEFVIEDQRPFREQTRRLKISNRGRYVTSLIFSVDYPTHFRLKPEFYPVLTPSGIPVTDSHQYCFIHHQSIMCGHGRVRSSDGRVFDFYRKLNFPEEGRLDRWHTPERNLYHLGPSGIQRITEATWIGGISATIDLSLEWQTRKQNESDGETIVFEKRRYEITQKGANTVIDHFSRLIPADGEAVLEADRHSFCGVRVSDLIDVEDGGRMSDSERRTNPEGNYWDAEGERKAPRWVDCSGRVGVTEVGVTLLGHPANLRNQYYMQPWGLMEVSSMLGEDVAFSEKTPFQFAARYLAHDGPADSEAIERYYDEFSEREFSF